MAPASSRPIMSPLVAAGAHPGAAHFTRMTASLSGTDRSLMLVQYFSKLAVWALTTSSAAATGSPTKPTALVDGLIKLSAKISDSRTTFRLFGMIPTLVWYSGLARKKNPPSAYLHLIERIQCVLIGIYYPLEHLVRGVRRNLAALTDRADFLGGHSIIRLSPAQISQAALWSCRAWAGYVILQLAHLYEDFRQLRVAERKVLPREERAELGKRRRHLENDLLVNLGYLPLTLQYSIVGGLYKNEVWTALFGSVAAVAQVRGAWRSSA